MYPTLPFKSRKPLLGFIKPLIKFKIVDLPHPLGPTIAIFSPLFKLKVKSFKTSISPSRVKKLLDKFLIVKILLSILPLLTSLHNINCALEGVKNGPITHKFVIENVNYMFYNLNAGDEYVYI